MIKACTCRINVYLICDCVNLGIYSLFKVDYFPPEVEVRAVLESQLLARKMYALRFGYKLGGYTHGHFYFS